MIRNNKRIFATFGETPIKNIKTPIKRFNGDEEEEVVYTPQDNDYYPQHPYYGMPANVTEEDTYRVLYQIKVLLFVLIILKLICLIRK